MNEKTVVTEWIRGINVPAALISYTYRALQKKFQAALGHYNLGWGHFIILMILLDREGLRQDEIALSRGFDKTMIAKSVIRLEEEDLVYRITDPDDRRVRRLFLTEAGKRAGPELRCIGSEISEGLLKDFTPDESQKLLEYLRRIAMNASEL